MPLESYHGDTFVAFIDISGFKVLMKDRKRAYEALNKFYQIGYYALGAKKNRNHPYRVDGIFISDCGILFSRLNGNNFQGGDNIRSALHNMLNITRNIFAEMIRNDLLLTASIAYGKFDYEERIEFVGIEKNLMLGNAYLDAYLDNENGKPRLEPGQCRILLNAQLNDLWRQIRNPNEYPFNLIVEKQTDDKHLYFYWMLQDRQDIERFDKKYTDTYNLKYRGMITVLREFSNRNNI
ncbi:hypothetical protein ACX8XP_14730 [Calditrichota bacterium LG25]